MKKTCFILFAVAAIWACKHTVETPADGSQTGNTGGGNTGGTPGSNVVCFETEVLPIFKSSCAKSGCHDVQSRREGYVLDSYDNIIKKGIKAGDANDSKIYKVLVDDDEDDRMPQRPNPRLTTAQINIIKKWINEGAKNTTNCGTTCDTTIFSYSQGVKPILETNCYGCHNGATTSAGINLTLYSGVRTVAINNRLLGAITHSAGYTPMPMGSNKLNDCQITKIRKWIQAGAPEN
ncbi:c-type cytochrome domain-containing protein [Aridibaculum aurantiacum]|uniref:c-type cytochrome domain-containing protein n=1 Tax=Aridibaculum aurantiacum TaxID=2810307 RepID=UPI001A9688AB|nr:c-type cytochrome domain-containing protein [Aridibaculum aurantiacum]